MSLLPKQAINSLVVKRNAVSAPFAGFAKKLIWFGYVYVFVINLDVVWLCMCRVYYG